MPPYNYDTAIFLEVNSLLLGSDKSSAIGKHKLSENSLGLAGLADWGRSPSSSGDSCIVQHRAPDLSGYRESPLLLDGQPAHSRDARRGRAPNLSPRFHRFHDPLRLQFLYPELINKLRERLYTMSKTDSFQHVGDFRVCHE